MAGRPSGLAMDRPHPPDGAALQHPVENGPHRPERDQGHRRPGRILVDLQGWLIDQWRQIGLNVKQDVLESAQYFAEIRGGNYQVGIHFRCGYIVEPDLALYQFQSKEISPDNYGRYTDKVLDDLYEKQSRTTDSGERRRLIREFEKRLLDDETHYVPTLQYHRIIPHSAKVRGWTITPSHYINQQLDTVWLAH